MGDQTSRYFSIEILWRKNWLNPKESQKFKNHEHFAAAVTSVKNGIKQVLIPTIILYLLITLYQ